MKVLFLLYFDLENTKYLGIKKKIIAQVNALNQLGYKVDLAFPSNNNLHIQNETSVRLLPVKKGLTNYRYSMKRVLKKHIEKTTYDNVYIRFPGSVDPYLYNTIKYLHKKGMKIYLEIPTYPIGGELISFLDNLKAQKKYIEFLLRGMVYLMHKILSRKLKEYILKVVTFMPYNEVWGTPTISIDNGVDFNNIKQVQKVSKQNNDIILLGVANVSKWHGYDRVIKGMKNYYENNDEPILVKFMIVGEGEENRYLKNLVRDYKLDNYVEFLGVKDGVELNELYNSSELAISSLGMHRIGVLKGSTIKTKEYCALGIPFIYGYIEREIDKDFKYALKVDSNDSPIDINEVLGFYSTISLNPNYSKEMHDFAREKYDWKVQMHKIFN